MARNPGTFIDDPAGSVGAAHTLLDQVMAERGYPTKDFEEQADLVSVDHPQVVDNYRAAYAVYRRQSTGEASTEDMRDALVRYRSLFEDLLRPEGGTADRTDARRTTAPTRGRRTATGPTPGRRPRRRPRRGRTDYRTNGTAAGVADGRYDGTADGRADVPSNQRADALRETRPDAGPSTTYGERP